MNKPTFTQREMSEIELSLFYAKRCKHGTDGHNRLLLIAKLANMLGIDMESSHVDMVIPDTVAVEEFDLGPTTPRVEKVCSLEMNVVSASSRG